MNLTSAVLYIDSSDTSNVGWAYRLIIDGREESGAIDCPIDADLDDLLFDVAELRDLDASDFRGESDGSYRYAA